MHERPFPEGSHQYLDASLEILNLLENLHPVHRLLHRLGLTIKGVYPRIPVLGPVTQYVNGLGMHVRELREGPDSQGEYSGGPLAEALPCTTDWKSSGGSGPALKIQSAALIS